MNQNKWVFNLNQEKNLPDPFGYVKITGANSVINFYFF
jgi:hypothetical protein